MEDLALPANATVIPGSESPQRSGIGSQVCRAGNPTILRRREKMWRQELQEKVSSVESIDQCALLWTYDLLRPINDVANPARDNEGLALERLKGRSRARASKELDSDF